MCPPTQILFFCCLRQNEVWRNNKEEKEEVEESRGINWIFMGASLFRNGGGKGGGRRRSGNICPKKRLLIGVSEEELGPLGK